MKLLEFFLERLTKNGFDWTCDWQMDKGPGRLDHYTIHKNGEFIQVIFQCFGESKGFTHYLESQKSKYDLMITEFNIALRPE